jgi:transposase
MVFYKIRLSPYCGKKSSNMQREMTVHHNFKMDLQSRKFQELCSSAIAKTIKRYDETGSHEDHHRKGRPRVTSAAEDKFIRVTNLRLQPKQMFQSLTDTNCS